MSIWNWFRRPASPKGTTPAPARYLPVSDDRDEQFALLPASLHDWAEEQLCRQAAFYHPESGGTGPYPLPGPPRGGVAALAIRFDDAVAALAGRLPRFDGVLPPGNIPTTGPAAFGPSALTAVILGRNRDGVLVDVELIMHGNIHDEELALLRGLRALSPNQPLIVVDWQFSRIARLDDEAELAHFLRA